MKTLLAAGIVAGITLTVAGMAIAQTPPVAPPNYDLDGDGYISVLDLTLMAQFFTNPAEPCLKVTRHHHPTPITSVADDGSPIMIEGYALPDPDQDPTMIARLLSGTPVFQCWP